MTPHKPSLLGSQVKKVFVTGGAGFIGSHIVDALMAQNYQVSVYDNLSLGKIDFIKPHFGKKGFQFVQEDLLDLDKLTESVAGHDLVWHLGANTDIPSGYERTDMDLKNCVIATCNMLEAMKRTGVRDMLFPSTGAVYGELCAENMVNESVGPLLPVSLYAAGKISCEAFIAAYCAMFGLRSWMFRFGNVLGARMGHGVIYDFIHKLLRNSKELVILGDGTQEKNYFLVEECIDGMSYLYRNVRLSDKTPCDVFNLGTDSVSTVTSIAKVVIQEMGLTDVQVKIAGGLRAWPGDQPKVHFSVERMKQLGWQARHPSDEAVRIAARRMIDSLKAEGVIR